MVLSKLASSVLKRGDVQEAWHKVSFEYELFSTEKALFFVKSRLFCSSEENKPLLSQVTGEVGQNQYLGGTILRR